MKKIFLFIFMIISVSVFSQTSTTDYKWIPSTSISLHLSAKGEAVKIATDVCGENGGCSWTYSGMMQAVHDYMTCMSEKKSILIDENQFDYAYYHLDQVGDLNCWGYAHHPDPELPVNIIPIKKSDKVKSCDLCTYDTQDTNNMSTAESNANAFIGSKTDILVFSSELVEDWIATGGDHSPGYYVYHYRVTYLRAFGSCY